MPGISDKLKALGVKLGGREIEPPREKGLFPIELVLEGRIIDTIHGQTYLREQIYQIGHRHGSQRLELSPSLDRLGELTGNPNIASLDPTSILFLDTETSGLAGGTGTYVFLVGIGRFETDGFHLYQYFLRDPAEERAHLTAMLATLLDAGVLVTFNGKAFDAPLLNTRFILNDDPPPLNSTPHFDLLPLARRLWRDRLSSRRLGVVEEHILKVSRSGEDIPGWLIPTLYFDYLRGGDARPLSQVFYHNAMDILSLVALLNHVSAMVVNPHGDVVQLGVEMVALGKIFEDQGRIEDAVLCYSKGLAAELPLGVRCEALHRWSVLEKRRNNLEVSIELWQEATKNNEIYAFEELAKVFEHRLKDIAQAIYWTESGLNLLLSLENDPFQRRYWEAQLQHRLERLRRKAG